MILSMAKILLVDDDVALCENTSVYLTSIEHHTVDVAKRMNDASSMVSCSAYDAIILDWELPDGTGIELLRKLRASNIDTPIIMLTGKNQMADKEQGFLTGADDYLTKPFHLRELALRLRVMLKRDVGTVSDVLTAGDIQLDAPHFKVTKAGEEITLLPKEFALLEFLLRHKNEVFSAETLLARVWSAESEATPGALRICLNRLRKRIDTPGQPSIIQNIHGLGYTVRD